MKPGGAELKAYESSAELQGSEARGLRAGWADPDAAITVPEEPCGQN